MDNSNLKFICEWLFSRDNWKDFIIPSLTIIFTILGSVYVAKIQFSDSKKKDKESERENQKKLEQFIIFTNKGAIKDLEAVLEQLKKDREYFHITKFLKQNYPSFNKTHFISLQKIELIELYSRLSNLNPEPVILNKYVSTVVSLNDNVTAIEKYYYYINEKYNGINELYNIEIGHITAWMADSLHKIVPPYTTVTLDLNIPEEALAFEVGKINEWYKKSKDELLEYELGMKLLERLDSLRFHTEASKALETSIVQKVLLAMHYRDSKKRLLETAQQTIDNYINSLIQKRDIIINLQNILEPESLTIEDTVL